ncbi:hypothetical protein ACIRSU_25700 [Streptomyces sp. NPDC101160]|uniref:hypothetical protein n=1 Tax=Streptomyces sp. NPDC101160 TaxID=3366118 RepID=UPI003822CFE2
MSTLDLSFGSVTVERVEASKPWITGYRLTGPRVRGTVEIAPEFHELRVSDSERAWEFLPTAFTVAYGRSTWNRSGASGTLEVCGSRLAEYTVVRPGQTDWDIHVRRIQTGIGDYQAPEGATARTGEIVRALTEMHRRDAQLVHEKAVEFLRSRRSDRLTAIEREAREVEIQLRTLKGRHAELRMRESLMAGEWAFETAIEEAAPRAGGTWTLGPAVPAFGAVAQ